MSARPGDKRRLLIRRNRQRRSQARGGLLGRAAHLGLDLLDRAGRHADARGQGGLREVERFAPLSQPAAKRDEVIHHAFRSLALILDVELEGAAGTGHASDAHRRVRVPPTLAPGVNPQSGFWSGLVCGESAPRRAAAMVQ